MSEVLRVPVAVVLERVLVAMEVPAVEFDDEVVVGTGHRFFPTLVSHPFAAGIHQAFYFAAACCAVVAVASWMRGGKYYHPEEEPQLEPEEIEAEVAAVS